MATAKRILSVAGLATLATGAAWAYAAVAPQSQIFGRTLIAGDDPSEAALTFDDGPNGDTTLRLLDVLAAHEARATFFLIGRFARMQPEVVKAIANAGHAVGNHTMTHPWLCFQSAARIREELAGCKAILEDITGLPIRYFRAPHGARRPFALTFARELGMTPVQWNVIAGDWNRVEAGELTRRLWQGVGWNRRRQRGSTIVLHDGGQHGLGQPRMPTVQATERILGRFAAEGIRAATLENWT